MRRTHELHAARPLPLPTGDDHHMRMEATSKLAEALQRRRIAVPAWQIRYDVLVDRLRRNGVGASAPQVGDRFPDFALPDANGRYRSLYSLLASGPLVLSFNRGGWCDYCRHELEAWSTALPELAAMGGAFASITAEVGGRAQVLAAIFVDPMTMFCDVDHGVSLEVGLAFHLDDTILRDYRAYGIDLDQAYGSSAGLLPIPATFLIASNGTVVFAFVDPDFRNRADPSDVLAALAASGS